MRYDFDLNFLSDILDKVGSFSFEEVTDMAISYLDLFNSILAIDANSAITLVH